MPPEQTPEPSPTPAAAPAAQAPAPTQASAPAAAPAASPAPTPTPAAVDVEYKLTAPEGQAADEKIVAAVVEFAKENKLTAEAAQKLLNSQVGFLSAQQQAADDATKATNAEWKAALEKDPEFGGPKLAAAREIVSKTVALGPPELKQMLESTGMGNHPLVFKWMHSIGGMLSEDRFVQSGAQPNGDGRKSVARSLYPNNP